MHAFRNNPKLEIITINNTPENLKKEMVSRTIFFFMHKLYYRRFKRKNVIEAIRLYLERG